MEYEVFKTKWYFRLMMILYLVVLLFGLFITVVNAIYEWDKTNIGEVVMILFLGALITIVSIEFVRRAIIYIVSGKKKINNDKV